MATQFQIGTPGCPPEAPERNPEKSATMLVEAEGILRRLFVGPTTLRTLLGPLNRDVVELDAIHGDVPAKASPGFPVAGFLAAPREGDSTPNVLTGVTR